MNLVLQLKRLVSRHGDDPTDVIARLLISANEDDALRRRMLFLLQSPTMHRQSLVNTALDEMKLRGEPENVRAAFALLATDNGAKIALSILDAQEGQRQMSRRSLLAVLVMAVALVVGGIAYFGHSHWTSPSLPTPAFGDSTLVPGIPLKCALQILSSHGKKSTKVDMDRKTPDQSIDSAFFVIDSTYMLEVVYEKETQTIRSMSCWWFSQSPKGLVVVGSEISSISFALSGRSKIYFKSGPITTLPWTRRLVATPAASPVPPPPAALQ
jgi:hypothetical protein